MELGEERDEGIPYWIVVAVVAGAAAAVAVAEAAVAAVETAAAKELDTTDSAVDPEMPLPDYPDSSSVPQPCFPFDSSHVPR